MRRAPAPASGRTLLDVGCGAGANLAMLSEFGRVTGLESDPGLNRTAAERHPELRIIHQPVFSPLEEKFDVICMFDVLEHIEDDEAALRWINDNLTDDGSVFLAVPAYGAFWSKDDELSHHFRRYTPKSLLKVINTQFHLARLTHYNTLLSPLIFLIIRIRKLLGRDRGGDFEKGSEGIINSVLKLIFCSEALWLRWFNLPFGVSLYAECRRKDR
jgi:SAM-dependent methyltransferase